MIVSASISDTDPGAYLRRRDIEGRSWSASLGVLHPLERRRDHSLWLEGSLNLRTVRQERADILVRRDRLAVARGGVYGFKTVLGGRLRGNATLSQGLDVLDATQAGDRLASRGDADGTFTTAALFAEWDGGLIDRVALRVAASSQFAFQPLLVSEEVGLGGGRFLRGYDYSERLGDEGAMASAELRVVPLDRIGPLAKPELYAFVDGGRVTNLSDGPGGGTLFSTGVGFRSTLFKTMTADIGLAVPLSGERYDTDSAAPVVNFRISRRF